MSARLVPCLALSLALGGCSASRPKAALAPAPAVAPRRATVTWSSAQIPGTGASATFPGEARESAGWTPGTKGAFYRALEVVSADQTFVMSEYELGPRVPDAQLLTLADKLVQKPVRRAPVELQGFRGVELAGESEAHRPKAIRAFAVGGSLLLLGVEATKGKIDDAMAEQFFASARLSVPWRVHPVPELALSVALPAEAFPLQSDENARTFYLGGKDELSFMVTSSPIAAELQSTPDDALNLVVESYGKTGTLAWSAPLELEGIRGREVLVDSGKEHLRGRVYARGDRLLQTIASAARKERLTEEDVKRFLDSLRWWE
jgi:hypothetical protein